MAGNLTLPAGTGLSVVERVVSEHEGISLNFPLEKASSLHKLVSMYEGSMASTSHKIIILTTS